MGMKFSFKHKFRITKKSSSSVTSVTSNTATSSNDSNNTFMNDFSNESAFDKSIDPNINANNDNAERCSNRKYNASSHSPCASRKIKEQKKSKVFVTNNNGFKNFPEF